MPNITKLQIQKNKKRVNVFIDNNFAFGLSLDEVISNKLSVGKVLSEKEIKDIFLQSQFELFYARVLNFLSYRPRSKKEIEDYLKKKLFKIKAVDNVTKEKIKIKILNKLISKNLINDEKFAQWWVEQRLNFKPRGKRFLKAELFQKGITRDIINKVLLSIDNEQLLSLAKKLVDKKLSLYKNLPKIKLKQKLYNYLSQKGFSYEIIKKTIDEKVQK